MKIVCIADTHAKTLPDSMLPDGDVLVHAGDVTNNGKRLQMESMSQWFTHLADTKYEHIVFVAGNHDFMLDAFRTEGHEYAVNGRLFPHPRVHYLRDERLWLNFMDGKAGRTLKFWGTPWTISGNWAFSEMDRSKRREIFAKIPLDTNVLISHGPPYSILDRTQNGEHFMSVGDLELLGATERVRPQLHVFGHIHDGYGVATPGLDTTFVNAASTQIKGEYILGNPPIVIDI
jgi:Icc-related predicted phosphoesterase